jgi:hypothetical protein
MYHFDHQGTTECLADGAGTVTDRLKVPRTSFTD